MFMFIDSFIHGPQSMSMHSMVTVVTSQYHMNELRTVNEWTVTMTKLRGLTEGYRGIVP